MTTIEKFMSFAQTLPADRLGSIEAALTELMESYSDKYELTPAELAEVEKRMAETHPEYSTKDAITAIFGKPFSA